MTGQPGPAVFISHGEFVINALKDKISKKIPFEIGKKYHIEIQQTLILGRTWSTFWTIYVNGSQIHFKDISKRRNYKNVDVYVSDPSCLAFTSEYGILQNFKYTVGNSDTFIALKQLRILKLDF